MHRGSITSGLPTDDYLFKGMVEMSEVLRAAQSAHVEDRVLGLDLIHSHFSTFCPMLWYSKVIAIQLRHEHGCLCPETSWNFSEKSVGVGILLLENLDELVSRNIDPFMPRIVSHVVSLSNGREARDEFSIIGIQYDQ